MKIKEGFVLRNVAGSNIVVPTGALCVDFNGMITLNDTGAFIWKELEKARSEEEIVEAILKEYDVERERAADCVSTFLSQLKDAGCLE